MRKCTKFKENSTKFEKTFFFQNIPQKNSNKQTNVWIQNFPLEKNTIDEKIILLMWLISIFYTRKYCEKKNGWLIKYLNFDQNNFQWYNATKSVELSGHRNDVCTYKHT